MYANTSLRNKYYVCMPQAQAPIPWDPSDVDQTPSKDCAYYGKVLTKMEQNLEVRDLVFYITWDTATLPSYGENVVAIVIGDEWQRIPTYVHRVRAVFKQYGTRPELGCNPLCEPSYANLLALMLYIKNLRKHLPGRLNYIFRKLRSTLLRTGGVSPIYTIPLGYYNQLDLPVKPIESRPNDVAFLGSVVHEPHSTWSLKRWLDTPKSLSRKKMIATMSMIEEEYPDLRVELSLTPGFQESQRAGSQSNSQRMMDTKICLVPRGASLETFRFFEALRYGCIAVTEALPSRWFYDGSPAVRIEDWEDLPRILEDLINDKQLMRRKHLESLKWWETRCSEAAVGAYIAEKLNPPKDPGENSEESL